MACATGLLFGLTIVKKRYHLDADVVTVLRAAIVILVGLRVVRDIERAMTRMRASRVERSPGLGNRLLPDLSWQESVTGIYLTRLLLYAGLALVTIFVVGGTFSGLLVGGTLITVTLGVASQSFFANFFGGLAVALFKPFEIGDQVQIVAWQFPMMPETYPHLLRAQGYRGIVRDINLFYSELRLDDGQLFRVPNGVVITAGLIRSSANEWARTVFRFDVVSTVDMATVLPIIESVAIRHFPPQSESPSVGAMMKSEAVVGEKIAPPLGWEPPVILIVDVSPATMSIEVHASVLQRLRDHAKSQFFAEIWSYTRPPHNPTA